MGQSRLAYKRILLLCDRVSVPSLQMPILSYEDLGGFKLLYCLGTYWHVPPEKYTYLAVVTPNNLII